MADLDVVTVRLGRAPPASTGFVQSGATLTPEPLLWIGKIQFLASTAGASFFDLFGQSPPAAGHCYSGEITVAWLAPNEWLLTGTEATVLAALQQADKAGDSGLATDLTHASASFQFSGKDARDRLAALTPLDISDTAMGVGRVARAPLGDTGMFLARLSDSDGNVRFRIIVDQTMAAYSVRMLAGPMAALGTAS